MTRFSKLIIDDNGKLVETDIREINQADMLKCPHAIMTPEHYRADGTCRCNDRDHREMKSWGYAWNNETNMWE